MDKATENLYRAAETTINAVKRSGDKHVVLCGNLQGTILTVGATICEKLDEIISLLKSQPTSNWP